MKNILIPTMPDDTHALYVKLALEKKGHVATLWYTADYPEQQKHSFKIQGSDITWQATGVNFEVLENNKFDVVWLRRPRRPILPAYLHPDDRTNAENENAEFFKTMWQVIAPNAVWVNPVSSLKAVNSKLNQLKIACEVGLLIPDSLFSNDPKQIKEFIRKHPQVIYKPIFPVYWVNEEATRLTYTSIVSEKSLPSDPLLQSTPGIYQAKINKAYELRITYFGGSVIAVKLDSQKNPNAMMDWRAASCFDVGVELYQLPSSVDKKCKEFMRRLNVKFGCFDFIVTPEGDYYFLEINEQGQFLWIEQVNPEIKMLDTFVNFLIESAGANCANVENQVSMSDFDAEVILMLDDARATHKIAEL